MVNRRSARERAGSLGHQLAWTAELVDENLESRAVRDLKPRLALIGGAGRATRKTDVVVANRGHTLSPRCGKKAVRNGLHKLGYVLPEDQAN
jgi:hypothetical protein